MEKIGWTDRVRKDEVLPRAKEERNLLLTVNRRKANWIGHIWRRNCLQKHVEGKIQRVTGGRGRCKQLLDGLKGKRGNCTLKEKALDRTVWKIGFGRGCGPAVRQTRRSMTQTHV
jgi:hypothetical protein